VRDVLDVRENGSIQLVLLSFGNSDRGAWLIAKSQAIGPRYPQSIPNCPKMEENISGKDTGKNLIVGSLLVRNNLHQIPIVIVLYCQLWL